MPDTEAPWALIDRKDLTRHRIPARKGPDARLLLPPLPQDTRIRARACVLTLRQAGRKPLLRKDHEE